MNPVPVVSPSQPEPAPAPSTKMGTCAKCGRGNCQVYKGGDVYWCKPCIRHEQRRRADGKTQEGE
jgi:hypothetical protein